MHSRCGKPHRKSGFEVMNYDESYKIWRRVVPYSNNRWMELAQ